MSDELLEAWANFKRLLLEEHGRQGTAETLEFAAAFARAEADVELRAAGNVVELRRPKDAA